MDSKRGFDGIPVLIRRLLVLSYDSLAIIVTWFLAFILHDNFRSMTLAEYQLTFDLLPIAFCSYFISFYLFKTYRGIWGFSSISDASRLVKGIVCGYVLVNGFCLFFKVSTHFIHAALVLHALLLLVMTGGARAFYRRLMEKLNQPAINKHRVLIIGAGNAGEGIIRDILRNKHLGYEPVAILDDARNKQGQEIHRVRVVGVTRQLKFMVKQFSIDLVIIALPSAPSNTMRRIVKYCNEAAVNYRTLPGLMQLTSGTISVSDLREVKIDDLLGRDQVETDKTTIQTILQNKRILVSGGGGSIGSELCRQIVRQNPALLIIVDNCEYNLFKIQRELIQFYPVEKIIGRLVDIADRDSLEMVFKQYCPQLVFHAAAFKHVPMLEEQLRLAVRNNILGSKNMADLAARYGVEKFVQVSTDKAVNPTNIMGMSKRFAEIYCQDLNKSVKTEFITVRFGNVLGSVGSVVPLFKEQLEKGGPLTVTHKEMTRYFMTIPEASSLILQAVTLGRGGEIFVLDMGEPVKISYLAEQLIRLSGKEPGKDIEIQYTGLRPGEKLYEELFHEGEQTEKTAHEKINQAKCRQFDSAFVQIVMQSLWVNFSAGDDRLMFAEMLRLVPEYKGTHPYHSDSTLETNSATNPNAAIGVN